jgi:hypothetical protein
VPSGSCSKQPELLAGTFIALGSLPLVFVTELGFAVAFGVLLGTFVVRSVLVTALNLDVGRGYGGRAACTTSVMSQPRADVCLDGGTMELEKPGRGSAAVHHDRSAARAIRYAEVNGGPAALLFAGGELFGVLVMDPGEQGDQVHAVYSVVNPDKLTWLAGALRELP